MKIRFQMSEWKSGASEYTPPSSVLIREVEAYEVTQIVDAFNEFLAGLFLGHWQVGDPYYVEMKDDELAD